MLKSSLGYETVSSLKLNTTGRWISTVGHISLITAILQPHISHSPLYSLKYFGVEVSPVWTYIYPP